MIVELNTNPSERQLRQFGLICVVACPLIVWLWSRNIFAVQIATAIGAALGIVGTVAPKRLRLLFVGMIYATFPIGLVLGELTMLLIYFGVFLPMALLFRIIGRDVLQRRSSLQAETFWKVRVPPKSVRKYYQQS